MDQDNRKIIDSFLAEIGSAVGKNIRLNDSGISAFTYEHLTFVVEVPDNVSTFFVYTTLMALPQCSNHSAVMKKVLQLNYLQQETRGGCVALDSMNDDIIFSYSDRINEINSTEFRNILENFIDTAINLYKEIQAADLNTAADDMPAQDFQPNMMMSGGPKIASGMGMPGTPSPKVVAEKSQLNSRNIDKPAKPSASPVAGLSAEKAQPAGNMMAPAKPNPPATQKKKPLEPLKAGSLNPQNSIMP